MTDYSTVAKYSKSALPIIICVLSLFGCASGQLDLYNAEGKKVGECTAGYDWHFYGAKHSVNWLLNWCAQNAIAEGIDVAQVSDPSVLKQDYSYPKPISEPYWTKASSFKAFRLGLLSEKEYGYILADIENAFYLRNEEARHKFESGIIGETDYRQLLKVSKQTFYGRQDILWL